MRFVAEYAILVTASDEEDVMRVIGGMGRDRFKTDAIEVDLGRGPCWVADQDILTPIEDVWFGFYAMEAALMTFELRDYQREAVDGLYNYWAGKAGENPLIVAPTGSGKTAIYRADRKGCNGFYWHTGF
jgi:ATP-dependent helicase YprA (DUF1998 family)